MPWKKNFDVDAALRKAGETFWSAGYEATSMTSLLDAMGIQKGSFYDTFGSKRDAYLRALDRYADGRQAMLDGWAADSSPIECLRQLLTYVRDDCIGPEGRKGCMLVNCALELAATDPDAQRTVQTAFEAFRRTLEDCLERARERGEVGAQVDPAATSTTLLGLVMSMRVFSRAGSPDATIQTLHDQALELLER
ncbi:MAG: TetR/AcrR family transcriptional regulator [Planctomycetota bacterium]